MTLTPALAAHCWWNRIVVLWDVCNDGIRNCCWYLPRYYCTLIMQVSAACNQQRNDCVILESDSLVTLWRRIQHPSDMGHILECWKQRPPVHVPERKSPAFRMHPRSTLASAGNECGKCSYPDPPTTTVVAAVAEDQLLNMWQLRLGLVSCEDKKWFIAGLVGVQCSSVVVLLVVFSLSYDAMGFGLEMNVEIPSIPPEGSSAKNGMLWPSVGSMSLVSRRPWWTTWWWW